MDPTLQQALREAYASAPSDVIDFDTIELRHPAFTEPIRVVNDFNSLTARLEAAAPVDGGQMVTFLAFAFEFERPAMEDSGPPEITITIDNVSREIVQNIELAQLTLDQIEVTYRSFLSTDLDTGPQNNPPLTMTIKHIKATVTQVIATAGFGDFANRRFPNQNYTATRFPGLVR